MFSGNECYDLDPIASDITELRQPVSLQATGSGAKFVSVVSYLRKHYLVSPDLLRSVNNCLMRH